MQSKHIVSYGILFAIFIAVFVASICFGSVSIPLAETIAYFSGAPLEQAAYASIIEKIRLPKAITASLAGAALSVAGLMMQTLFRNPLADPFVLGINSGASLGVAIVVMALGSSGYTLANGLSFGGNIGLVTASGVGGSLIMILVLKLSRKVDMMTLLILGLMLSYITGAIVSILMYLSLPEQLQSYMSWSFGEFGSVEWREMPVFSVAILCAIILTLFCGKPLNGVFLGEFYARSLGVNIKFLKAILIISASLLAGTVTAYCGPIGFIGVAVPHLCRGIIKGSDHRLLIPCCILVGASVALAADIVSQIPGSTMSLPLNAVTALLGAPVIIYVLLKRNRLRDTFAR